ncbi:hypothetical protein EDD17DRAFT_1812312, partial [Pisolithus thermaeus]
MTDTKRRDGNGTRTSERAPVLTITAFGPSSSSNVRAGHTTTALTSSSSSLHRQRPTQLLNLARKYSSQCQPEGNRRNVLSFALPQITNASDNPPDASPSTEEPANLPRKPFTNIFRRSRQSRSEHAATKTIDASPGEQVDAAQKALHDFQPISPALQAAAGTVGQANTAMTSIQNIEAILQPLKLFNSFVTSLSN